MIRGSALYLVIIIALVIATLCSSMIVATYFYKLQQQRKFRFDRLENNLESGISIILSDSVYYPAEKIIDLYKNQEDTISIQKIPWGFYDLGVVKAHFQKDTLIKSFLIGSKQDSLKRWVIYLSDEERPLYVSGRTYLKGVAYLPKSGIKESYVEGISYEGDERLLIGQKQVSKETLPPLNINRLNFLEVNQSSFFNGDSSFNGISAISNSFLDQTRKFYFKNMIQIIRDISLKGNIILFSNNHITIDSTASLDNIIVFANSISIKSGFAGRVQMFAKETIIIEKHCVFKYPSAVGVIKQKTSLNQQPRIALGDSSVFQGILFTYEKDKSDAQTLIDIGKDTRIEGEVFSRGMIRFKDGAVIHGSITANRVIYETNSTLFENYLVNTTINSELLSPYYLTSAVFSVASSKRKVLEWLDLK